MPDLLDTDGLEGYYGEDGFGDVFPETNTTQFVKKETAAEAIIKLVKEHPKEISLICVGPLSNLAVASLLDENLMEGIKEIYIMGGNAIGYGNVRQGNTAEWNFHMDPEAAHIVFSQASFPIHVLTWEACLKENFFVSNVRYSHFLEQFSYK